MYQIRKLRALQYRGSQTLNCVDKRRILWLLNGSMSDRRICRAKTFRLVVPQELEILSNNQNYNDNNIQKYPLNSIKKTPGIAPDKRSSDLEVSSYFNILQIMKELWTRQTVSDQFISLYGLGAKHHFNVLHIYASYFIIHLLMTFIDWTSFLSHLTL